MTFPRYQSYKDSGIAWLGAMPRHWVVQRLRFVAEINPSKSEVSHLAGDTDVSFLPMEAIGDDGSLELDRVRPLADVQTGYTYFRDGDVTVAKITPCFENGKGAAMRNLCNGIGFGTTELIVARPRATQTISAYLHWLFSSRPFRKAGESFMYGAGGQKRVPDDFVRDFSIGFPPLAEQATIATFLDHETAKIDTLVAEQQRLIELLKEKRMAVISQAVTKGLDPNVPMKDSGVEWLGKVPAHWQVQDLKYLASRISSGKTPLGGSETYVDDGVMLLRSQNVYDEGLRLDDVAFITEDTDEQMASSRVQAGDILLNITGASIGRTCLVPDVFARANVNQHVCVVRMRSREVAKFVAWSLKAPLAKSYMSFIQNGAARDGLTFEQIGNLSIAVPPASEQQAIEQNIAEVTKGIDDLILEVTSGVALLQERRSALISAAVTGKIDVRGLVPQAEAVTA